MVKLDEKEKKTLDEAFLRYILEILKLNTEKSPLFKQSLIEFAKSGLPIPTTFLYAKQANKWSSLARIILLQNNQKSEKLSSLLSTSQDKTPSFMGKKDENLKLKEDNEKLKVLIAALEKKLNLNLHELQSFQEDDSNDFKALAKELGNVSIKDLEAISKEKDMILDHLTRLNQEFSDYNQKLLAVKGENTQESNLLLFKFANLKDPKADLKTKIKELKEENHYLKQKLTDIYGASIDLPLQVSNGELNKSSKNQESQIIKKNRNTYEMSPNKIFDPIRSHKVENLAYSDIEVLFQVRNNKERSYSAQKERESYKKTLNEPFSGSDMRESVKLEQKDRSFYMRKTNKNEDFLVEDKKIKNRANGFRIGVLEQMKEFKDFEEFAKERINQLKKACLMNRGVLYEDNEVQLGFVSGVFYHKEEIFLKITAYFGNMSDKDLEKFEVKFIGNSTLNLWTKPRPPETNLAAKSQEKQELILKYSDIPFTSLLQKVSFKFQGQFKRSVLVLPCTLNKFLLEKSTDLQEFNAKWKEFREFSLCYTDQFQANPYLVKGPSNMKIYFQYLIHLNPENEYDFLARKGKLVLGGCFGVDKEQEVLLKIVFYGSGTVGLKAAAKAKEFKICEFLLKTLIFLLKKT